MRHFDRSIAEHVVEARVQVDRGLEGALAAQVDAELDMGGEVFVSGTPSMFVNGQRVSNPTDFELVKTLIDAELAKLN